MDSYKLERYDRQMLHPQIARQGQYALLESSVLVIGAGGLGSVVLYYLAAAGVGRIGIVDNDRVSLSNLNRQILYDEADIGQPKAITAAKRLKAFNDGIVFDVFCTIFDAALGAQLVSKYDLVIDCVDNDATRHEVNRACVQAHMPLIEGGIAGFQGYVLPILPGQTACYACLYASSPQRAHMPVAAIGPVAGAIGAIQACQAILYLIGEPMAAGSMHVLSLADIQATKIPIQRAKDCPVCGMA